MNSLNWPDGAFVAILGGYTWQECEELIRTRPQASFIDIRACSRGEFPKQELPNLKLIAAPTMLEMALIHAERMLSLKPLDAPLVLAGMEHLEACNPASAVQEFMRHLDARLWRLGRKLIVLAPEDSNP